MKLALCQTCSPAGDIEAAFATITPALFAAAAMKADMLVLPELMLPGYNLAQMHGQPRGGAWHKRLAALAKSAGCGLTLGYAETKGPLLYNAAVTFDATGSEIAHYRKIQLYGPREHHLFTPGDQYTIFDLNGIKTALLICYDIEFAPHIAALAGQGVQLVLTPTANMLPFSHVSRATVPAMAANHGVTIVYANFCGAEGDLSYAGGSLIVGAAGEVLAQAGQGATLLLAEIPTVSPNLLSTQAQDYRPIP